MAGALIATTWDRERDIEGTILTTILGPSTDFVHVNMKGCANEEVCDYLKRGLNETGLEKNVKLVKANCELPLLAAN